MRYVGIDIASQSHVVAVVDEAGSVLVRPTVFGEMASGYEKLFEILGDPSDCLVAMEATGHHWKNLFVALCTRQFKAALLNPVRTRRFAEEDLQRTKTDAIDALGIARFAAQKRPTPTQLSDEVTEELREMIHLRDRLTQDFGDRVRQLHRLVDLGFPEFKRYVKDLGSRLAISILEQYPTARAYERVTVRRLASLCYDGRHFVGEELAKNLVDAAKVSVGAHHGEVYRTQVQYLSEDLNTLRQRLKRHDENIEAKLAEHKVGSILTTIDGIGPTSAARLASVLGQPIRFQRSAALTAYVGAVPALRLSGKSKTLRGPLTHIGSVPLRTALWMPTLTAVRRNPWLRAYYLRLIANGKPRKVALMASMRKLLTAVFSVAKSGRPFTPHLPEGTTA